MTIHLKSKQAVKNMFSSIYFYSFNSSSPKSLKKSKKRVLVGMYLGNRVTTNHKLYEWINSGQLAQECIASIAENLNLNKPSLFQKIKSLAKHLTFC